jgi:hypothetical protein
MTQEEILEFLKEHDRINPGGYVNFRQIVSGTHKTPGACSKCLESLRHYDEVDYKLNMGMFVYRHKKNMVSHIK